MNYIILRNGTPEPYSIEKLRKDNPNVSFPKTPNAEQLAKFGVFPLRVEDQPVVGPFELATLNPTPELVNGEWVQKWSITTMATKGQNSLVNAERDRRVVFGKVFTLAGYGDVHLAGDELTQTNLQALAFGANLRIAQGDTTTTTPFRDQDNVIHLLTPLQIVDLWSQGSAYISALFQAAWVLKDNPPIPNDYTDDKYWP